MQFRLFSKLYWRINYRFSRLGWLGIIAISLFATAAGFWFLMVIPLQEQIVLLQAETQILKEKTKAQSEAPKVLNPADQLAKFYEFFPDQEEIPDDVAVLFKVATEKNIIIEQAEYRLTPINDSRLARYEVVLPVKGGYLEIRQFIAQVLDDLPNLAMDSVIFTRQKIGDTQVDAQMKFTFYLIQE